MSEVPPRDRTRPGRWWNRTLWGTYDPLRSWRWINAVVVTLLLILIDAIFLNGGLTLVPLMLIFGWIGFVIRVAGDWRWSHEGVVTFVCCAGLLCAGAHLFLRWLRRAGAPAAAPWRLRWTLAMTALVVVLFGVGVAALGIVHQSTWLIREPLFRKSMAHLPRTHLSQLEQAMELESMTAQQARIWMQSRLPAWRVVVIPSGVDLGAVVVGEEIGGETGAVTVAIVYPDKPHFMVSHKRRTTVAQEVFLASALVESFAAHKAAAQPASDGSLPPLAEADPQPPIPDPR